MPCAAGFAGEACVDRTSARPPISSKPSTATHWHIGVDAVRPPAAAASSAPPMPILLWARRARPVRHMPLFSRPSSKQPCEGPEQRPGRPAHMIAVAPTSARRVAVVVMPPGSRISATASEVLVAQGDSGLEAHGYVAVTAADGLPRAMSAMLRVVRWRGAAQRPPVAKAWRPARRRWPARRAPRRHSRLGSLRERVPGADGAARGDETTLDAASSRDQATCSPVDHLTTTIDTI